jgi:hypothetical protein
LAVSSAAGPIGLCEKVGREADCAVQPETIEGRAVPTVAAGPETSKPSCSLDWAAARKGDCLLETSVFNGRPLQAYVHPGGWIVDPRCFGDTRFTADALLEALNSVRRKMDPKIPVAKGGCLSRFNPQWGAELLERIWTRKMYVSCPSYEKDSPTCGSTNETDSGIGRMLSLKNAAGCMGRDGTGLAGILFHESLHAAGADNFGMNKHNKAWELPQYEFVRDQVYGAEAVCFFGLNPKTAKQVNFLQCKNTAEYHSDRPRDNLCDPFPASFTDMPAGFWKH